MLELTTTLRLTLLTLVVCSVGYAAAILGFASIVAPGTAEGSLVRDASGNVVGSIQVAQAFTQPEYFWPRPSAVDYDASATGGSNLSPANPELTVRAQDLIKAHGVSDRNIPADLVSSSGSGIDPHISLEAALFQAPRVAGNRGLSEEQVNDLIVEVSMRAASILPVGGNVVNVLELNLALDAIGASPEIAAKLPR